MNPLDVIKDYTELGMLKIDIMKKYGITNHGINKILKSHNIELRSRSKSMSMMNKKRNCGKKYSYNQNYFKTWSSNMAYILGFIAADGNVCDDTLTIGLQDSDRDFLLMIANELRYNGEIKEKRSKVNGKLYTSANLQIYSKTMCEDLKNLGIVKAKSLIVSMSNDVPNEYIIDYIRGYFDGDGSIGHQKQSKCQKVQIRSRINSGSSVILEQFRDYLALNGLKNIPVKKQKSGIYEIFYSTMDSMKLYNIMYYSNDVMCLQRKRDKFEELISMR